MLQRVKNYYHFVQAIFANTLYLAPSRGLTIIGVTGTDGKTTTASLIYHILHHAGYKAALISSIGAVIDGKASDIGYHLTTPGRFAVQSYLKQAKKSGVQFVVLEVTSHALDQHRVFGVHFDVGVITNVTREHLDYHKTYERYVSTKSILLRKAKVAIVNKDDHSYWQIRRKELRGKEGIITYGMKKDADINPHNFQFTSKLIGQFNRYNCLAAIAALQAIHVPDDDIRSGIGTFKLPEGRQEIIYNKEFMVVNDFAHTPNSFAVILPEMKKITNSHLIHVFGAAAKRDTYKRAEMGKLSSMYADILVITAEDPRDEPLENITNQILSGISDKRFENVSEQEIVKTQFENNKKYIVTIADRKKAVHFAIGQARKGDVVLLTGKGHEKSMNYGNGEEAYDENTVAKASLKERKLL